MAAPLTHRVNILRGVGTGAHNARKTQCVNGHPFDDTNTMRRGDGGHRRCRICWRAAGVKVNLRRSKNAGLSVTDCVR